ncbi:hypothetical protein DBB29_09265 [Pandoraea cepalis]|uniref:Lipoprotein n=1 Tax=Pandoraea cepalis TaxID=2508294 RepID=A0AAW7MLZ7_9BURK|nr:hypothetical protein [Pandoraea cepalis]MDN4573762.1 hypothetical protein [Pandoraea cepalis]MDN4578304.1 hypothetical protein [Pandoraea cepalis]
MIQKLPILAHARGGVPAVFCLAAALLVTGCATSTAPRGPLTSARSGAPDAAQLREHHLAAADTAADQYRTCLYGHVARYVDLVPDPIRLADEAAAECAPITGRFRRERQAAVVTYTSATDASQQADAATLALQADGLRVARARARELRALR